MTTETTLYARNLMLDALGDDFYVALFSATPGETGGGTEISTGGYGRLQVLMGDASSGARDSTTSVTFIPLVAVWELSAIGVYDAPTDGNLLGWQAYERTVEPGQELGLAAGVLRINGL